MNSIGRDIFKAVHEGKWLSIEYRNKQGSITKYWIGIYGIYRKSGLWCMDRRCKVKEK